MLGELLSSSHNPGERPPDSPSIGLIFTHIWQITRWQGGLNLHPGPPAPQCWGNCYRFPTIPEGTQPIPPALGGRGADAEVIAAGPTSCVGAAPQGDHVWCWPPCPPILGELLSFPIILGAPNRFPQHWALPFTHILTYNSLARGSEPPSQAPLPPNAGGTAIVSPQFLRAPNRFPQHWGAGGAGAERHRCGADKSCGRRTQGDHVWCRPPCPPILGELLSFPHNS